ncbi:MAG TPA: two-component sensor histidine kinase, partial [Rhodocyclaceae bacterium]|nr:two-component sensor histidine kinase [Rhodocyclaceae bacterium]
MKIPGFLSGIRGKLIAIFVLIKVLPLLLLAWFAWHAARSLGEAVSSQASAMADATLETVGSVGKTVTDDSIRALDLRSREAVEAMTTDTAHEIASFLYDRDRDVLALSDMEPSASTFSRFLDRHTRPLYR